jgi:hypothetical protein
VKSQPPRRVARNRILQAASWNSRDGLSQSMPFRLVLFFTCKPCTVPVQYLGPTDGFNQFPVGGCYHHRNKVRSRATSLGRYGSTISLGAWEGLSHRAELSVNCLYHYITLLMRFRGTVQLFLTFGLTTDAVPYLHSAIPFHTISRYSTSQR